MRRKTLSRCLGLAAVLAAVPLTGCALGNTWSISLSRTTTIGQELIDLQQAKEKGAIDDAEYARTRTEIMKQASWDEFSRRNSSNR